MLNFKEIAEFLGKETTYDAPIKRAVIDSRKVEKGDLFVAVHGERTDGNQYIEDALMRGATAVIAETDYPGENVIKVPNAVTAFGKAAKLKYLKHSVPVIAVTGSSGKTTTKDMIYYILSEKFRVRRAEGNHNNELGLPLTLFEMQNEDEILDLEMGMYTFGEIRYLCSVVRPDIAVITNIGTAHIENLKSQENIFKAKMEIAENLTKSDTLIVNGDDKFLKRLKYMDKFYKLITYGFDENNDVRCIEYSNQVTCDFFGEQKTFSVPLPGKHNVMNAMAALSAAYVAGLNIDTAINGLKNFKTSEYRMEEKIIKGIDVINDVYNANPDSMKAALSVLGEKTGRKIAVLGDMLELGDESEKFHIETGEYARDKADYVITCGDKAKFIAQGFGKNYKIFTDKMECADFLKKILREGDTVLFKASRGESFEKLVDFVFKDEV